MNWRAIERESWFEGPNGGRLFWLGIAAIACYGTHAAVQLAHGRPENLLWACHMAALCVGIGLVFRCTTLVAIGCLLLTVGVPSWLVNLAAGGKFYPTSVLTHLGGLACGILGLRWAEYPRHAPCWALVLLGTLLLATRLLTPPVSNVNVAFAPWHAGEEFGRTGSLHLLLVLAVWAAALTLADAVLRWGHRRFARPSIVPPGLMETCAVHRTQ